MRRNIPPCTRPTMKICGVRTILRPVRVATARVVAKAPAGLVGAWIVMAVIGDSWKRGTVGRDASGGGRRGLGPLVGRLAGEVQEHLVEGRPPQADLLDLDAGVVEDADG